MILVLAQQSAGIAIGTFIGVLIGLSSSRRRGSTQWLLGGSLMLTALVAAFGALCVAMFVTYMIGSTS